MVARLGAELLNVSVDACGGMASDAWQLVHAIREEVEKWSAGTWSSGAIERQLLGASAVAVQRGNALTMLFGYKCASVRAAQGYSVRVGEEGERTRCERIGRDCYVVGRCVSLSCFVWLPRSSTFRLPSI